MRVLHRLEEPGLMTSEEHPSIQKPPGDRRTGRIARLRAWATSHPVMAILLVSLVSVLVNSYPVVFGGKSYVSPARVLPLLYGGWPPLPGMAGVRPEWDHGS